ncbi:MAG TPA: oligosaccharide flippase family protein [Blastocatellia bacterium]|nr:oligosaccharide flippase family protein [Blastocatellia bacterium]
MLFTAHSGATAMGFLASLVQANWMAPAEVGRFAFCLAIVMIGGLFFEFGVFSAGARVLALSKDDQRERQVLGALVLMGLAIGGAFALFIAAAAVPIDLIFKKDVRGMLLAASGFAFFQPLQWLVEQSCQGLNRVRRLSEFHLLRSAANLATLFALAVSGRLTSTSALVAYLTGLGIAATWTLAYLRPRFSGTRQYMRLTLRDTRSYGLNTYLARITGAVSARFDNLVIGYFAEFAPLGLYSIAQRLSAPIVTISRAVAVSRYRAFSNLNRVPARITRWNAAVLLLSAAALVIGGPLVLKLAFPKYVDAAPLLIPLAIFGLFAGLFQPYNLFLASHGRGTELRNTAGVVSVASLAGLFLLVPRYGIAGAAWSGAMAMALDYLLHLYYYRQFRRTLTSES